MSYEALTCDIAKLGQYDDNVDEAVCKGYVAQC